MVICLSAVLALGTFKLVRYAQEAREEARRARLAALDARMRQGYRLKIRSSTDALAPRPKLKSTKKKV